MGPRQAYGAWSQTADTSESTPRGRLTYLALSVLIVLFILVQIVAVSRGTYSLYPITDWRMFSGQGDPPMYVEYPLVAQLASGDEVLIQGEDLALTNLQWRSHLHRNVGTSAEDVKPGAADELGSVAEIWSDRQGEQVVNVVLLRAEHWLEPAQVVTEEIVRWER